MQSPCYLDPPLTLSLPFPPPFSPPQARIAARKVVPPAPPENLQQWKLQIWCFPPTMMIALICVWGERTRLSSSANSSVSMHKLIYLRFSKNNNSWAYFFAWYGQDSVYRLEFFFGYISLLECICQILSGYDTLSVSTTVYRVIVVEYST